MSAKEQFDKHWVDHGFGGLDRELFRALAWQIYNYGWEDGIKTWVWDTGKVMDDLKARIKELEAHIPDAGKMEDEKPE